MRKEGGVDLALLNRFTLYVRVGPISLFRSCVWFFNQSDWTDQIAVFLHLRNVSAFCEASDVGVIGFVVEECWV